MPPVDDRSLWTWLVPNPTATGDQLEAAAAEHNVVAASRERMFLAAIAHILEDEYGLRQSIRGNRPIDAAGDPVPLYTYPATHYLDGLDWSWSDVFEFGAGYSTVWWGGRARSVTAVDTDVNWAEAIQSRVPSDVTVTGVAEADLPQALDKMSRGFDVIAIDCAANRYDAAEVAVRHLNPGGAILLDNSEWYYNTAGLLRDAGLIEIDFPGFKPTEFYASVTSLFLRPDFRPRPRRLPHPPYPIGGKRRHRAAPQSWDVPSTPPRRP